MTGSDPEAARRGGHPRTGERRHSSCRAGLSALSRGASGIPRRRAGRCPVAPLPRGGATNPQQARDQLAHQFLVRAFGTTGTEQASYREAAAVLDRDRHDLITAAGRQFRIVRAGQVARTGPDGPNHPGPPTVPALTGQTQGRCSSRTPMPTGISHQPHSKPPCEIGRARPGPPPELIADERRARTTLTTYLRQTAPTWEKPGEETCVAYAQAADGLESAQFNEITAAGRRFRVSRVERYVRTGPAGLEPPRPSDHDPYPPPAA